MPKVLITLAEVDYSTVNVSVAKNIITWFDTSYVPSDTLPLHTWERYDALISNFDECIEILKQGDKYCFVPLQSIVRIEDTSKECNIHLTNRDYISSTVPIDFFEEVFKDHKFFRVHANHLINLMHMNRFVRCNAFITLSNSDAIPVGSGNEQKIIEFLNKQTII
jgi:DNA-binding LytR/AlgR family response regulator